MADDDPHGDRQYAKDRARILKLKDKWLAALGLRWWHIDLEYSREPLPVPDDDKARGWQKNAQCVAKWQYLRACITFNMPAVANLSDDALEVTFVHEATHALVNEMRNVGADDGMDHEERVVTSLTNAFLWVREAAEKDRKTKRKGDTMPGGKKPGPSIKNPRMYEALKEKRGMSKQRAAKISNAAARKSRRK